MSTSNGFAGKSDEWRQGYQAGIDAFAAELKNSPRRNEAKNIADRYAIGSLRDQLEYEIHAAINLAVACVTGIPPGPVDPPRPPPDRVA